MRQRVVGLLVSLAAARVAAAQHTQPPAAHVRVTVGGARRDAWVVNGVGRAGRPLVLALHGAGGTAAGLLARTAWPASAVAGGFVLIAPQGLGGQWNDGRAATATGVVSRADDVALLDTLIATARATYGIDARRVFVAGVSNGGLMTFRFACERPGRVAGIGAVVAKLPRALGATCRPAPPVPLFLIVGTADPLMAYDGRPTSRFARGLGPDVLTSVPATLAYWARRNGCRAASTGGVLPPPLVRPLPHRDPADPTRVRRLDYVGCPPGGVVSALVVEGGGHREPTLTPRPVRPGVVRLLGRENHDVETAAALWAFFAGVPVR